MAPYRILYRLSKWLRERADYIEREADRLSPPIDRDRLDEFSKAINAEFRRSDEFKPYLPKRK